MFSRGEATSPPSRLEIAAASTRGGAFAKNAPRNDMMRIAVFGVVRISLRWLSSAGGAYVSTSSTQVETEQAAQRKQNQPQKPLASLRQAQYKGFDTPPQKAWRLLNQRLLHWPEQLPNWRSQKCKGVFAPEKVKMNHALFSYLLKKLGHL